MKKITCTSGNAHHFNAAIPLHYWDITDMPANGSLSQVAEGWIAACTFFLSSTLYTFILEPCFT